MKHIYYDDANEHVYILKLKSGLHVHFLPKSDPSYLTYAELSVPYGNFALNIKTEHQMFKLPPGTAHFLEHKIFAMPDGNDGFQLFTKLGTDANAMTGYTQTSYLFTATDHVEEALMHLLDMLDTTHFTNDNVNSERQIIAEEIKMYLDDPQTEMLQKLMNNMYENHPIKHDIGGSLSSIEEIKPETLQRAYDYFYQPNKRLLVIAGKMDIKKLSRLLQSYDKPYLEKRFTIHYEKEPNRILRKNEVVIKPMKIPKLMLGVKLVPTKGSIKNAIKRELAFGYLLGMLFGPSSSLMEMFVRKGLVNQNFYYAPIFETNAEHVLIYAETKTPHKLKKLLTDALIDGNEDINEENFERFKKASLGQHVFSLNSIEYKAHLYSKYYHQKASLFDAITYMRELSFSDVTKAKEAIRKNRIASVIYKKG